MIACTLRPSSLPLRIAMRRMSPVEMWTVPLLVDDRVRLRALADSRRPHDDDVHARYLRARRRPFVMKPS